MSLLFGKPSAEAKGAGHVSQATAIGNLKYRSGLFRLAVFRFVCKIE